MNPSEEIECLASVIGWRGGKWKSIEVEIMSFVAGKLMMIIDRVVQSSAEMTV